MADKTDSQADPGYEVLGPVTRVLSCTVQDSDRKRCDDAIHQLLDRQTKVRGLKLRIANASKKARERLTAIDEEITALHEEREQTTVDRAVRCEARRTETEVHVVRLDTGVVVGRRPLTAEEHAALHPRLSGTGPAPKVHAVELDVDETTARRVKADEEHAAKVAELLTDFDVQAALDGSAEAPAANDDEPAPEAKPKGKAKGGKGKKAAKKNSDLFEGGEG